MARIRANSNGNSRNQRGSGESFWDRPMLINLLADVLLLASGVLLAWAGAVALQRLPVLPLKQLVVATPVDHVSRSQIEYTARSALSGNFFTVNLETARAAFERMPWVRSASLRRLWPDGIELKLEEHQAAARWTSLDGEARLVSVRGEVFIAAAADVLPVFVGPEGSASRVLERYREFSDGLAGSGRKPVAIQLSAREAWQLKLDDGVVLELGRDEPRHPLAERVGRFANYYAAASSAARNHLQGIGAVDMRYPNGFALRGIAALSPEGNLRPPPPVPRPRARVTSHLPRLAGEDGRGCRKCQAHSADGSPEAA